MMPVTEINSLRTTVTGKYFETGKAVAPAPLVQDEALAKRLWDVSAAMTGLAPASAA